MYKQVKTWCAIQKNAVVYGSIFYLKELKIFSYNIMYAHS